jgi:hypothetical protein
MGYPIQLDFFKTAEQCEIDALRIELATTKDMLHKVRKGLYAKLGDHAKKLTDLEDLNIRLERIERNICNGNGK